MVQIFEQPYDKAISAIQMNGVTEELFRATPGVRQGCFLSPTLFNNVFEMIMFDAVEEHVRSKALATEQLSICGRFADDIDALYEEEQEVEALVVSLDKTGTRYKMTISAEKIKPMTNSANDTQM